MCGIYGIVSAAELRHPQVVDLMGEALRHRGPDGHATFTRSRAIIGTERLRIIDLHERAGRRGSNPRPPA